MRPRLHVFVCTNGRPEGGRPACAGRGGAELCAELARSVLARGLAREVQVTPSGCLGPCFDGPNLVIYPAGAWYVGLRLDDVPALVDHLGGAPAPVGHQRASEDD